MTLTDEDRQTLTKDRTGLLEEIDLLGATVADHARNIETHEKIAAARSRLAAASSAEADAKSAVAEAAPDRDKLARLDTALDLRTEHNRAERAGKAVTDLAAAEVVASARQSELAGKEAEAGKAQRKATDELAQAEHIFEALGPDWTRATDLTGRSAPRPRSRSAPKPRSTRPPEWPKPAGRSWCGATEHPVSADEALAGVARDLRVRLEAERKGRSEATRAVTEAGRRAEAARLAIETGTEARVLAEGRIAKAEASRAPERRQPEPASSSCPAAPPTRRRR